MILKPYNGIDKEFLFHEIVYHSAGGYVRGEIHTNAIENYFSILRRELTGIYQHVGVYRGDEGYEKGKYSH
jgi:hypothetical protein